MGGASVVLRPDVGLRQVLRLCSKLDILEERSSHRGLRLATLWPWPYQLPVLSSPFTAPGLHSPLGVVFLRLLSPPPLCTCVLPHCPSKKDQNIAKRQGEVSTFHILSPLLKPSPLSPPKRMLRPIKNHFQHGQDQHTDLLCLKTRRLAQPDRFLPSSDRLLGCCCSRAPCWRAGKTWSASCRTPFTRSR